MLAVDNQSMREKHLNYRFNFLLKIGAVIFCCTLFLYFIIYYYFENDFKAISRVKNITNNYFYLVFTSLILAPLFEELAFRGYFKEKPFYQVISFIGIAIFIFFSNNFYLYLLYLSFIIIHFLKKKNIKYLFFINSLIFSLVHYNFNDFDSVFTILPMFFQFALGLILIWVVLNFNLLKSILLHFLFNFILIVILTIPLQFPDNSINIVEHSGFIIESQKVAIFNGNTIISRENEFNIVAKNVNIIKFYKIFNSNFKNIKISKESMFYNYDIKIEKLDTTKSKLDYKKVKLLLKESKLIE